VFVQEDGILVDAPPRAWAGWAGMVKKFVNPRLAPHVDESAALRDLGIFGATARHVVSEVTGVQSPALTALAPYAHVSVQVDGVPITVARVPELELEGFELLVPADAFTTLWARAVAAGAKPAGLEAWDIARVEAGRPEWGIDIDDNTIPQEANFDDLHAISYTKGCYVGQETVARVHFRGHVNRHLRGVRASGLEPLQSGATLHGADGAQVGDVRSTVRSPRLGAIALAMIRREVEPGASLVARWTEREDAPPIERLVDVAALPFAV
jgi:folate-binding protein YgfZ